MLSFFFSSLEMGKRGWGVVLGGVLSNIRGPLEEFLKALLKPIVVYQKSTFFKAFSDQLWSAALQFNIGPDCHQRMQFVLTLKSLHSAGLPHLNQTSHCCSWPIRAHYCDCSDNSQSLKRVQLKPFQLNCIYLWNVVEHYSCSA